MRSGFSCNKEQAGVIKGSELYYLGCLGTADSGLVFKYEARPKPNLILSSKERTKSRA